MRPTQVTSERCLAKSFKILHCRGKRMPSIQIKSKSFLEHNVYLGKTLSDFPFVVTLMFMHRHWSPTHFRIFLCIRFQNIRPVFGKFSLSVFFPPKCFLSSQLEFLIEEKNWCFKFLIRNPLLKLFTEARYFHHFFFFSSLSGEMALSFRPELKLDIFP